MEFPFPVLLCDIGGTNARFALAPAPGAPVEPAAHVRTADHKDFAAALEFALARVPARPASLIACAAGPVIGRTVSLTNAGWVIDMDDLTPRARLRQSLLLNDFEAQALSLPALRPGWVARIGAATDAGRSGPELVIGLGTGLGAAALIETAPGHYALATEVGHMDFGPKGPEEAAIWAQIDPPHGRISAETILSGPGLVRLHRARRAAAGAAADNIDEVALVSRATADPGGEEARTLALLWTLVARFSGDLALAFLATGGVTFAGGVLPKLARFLDATCFRAHFEDKAPFRPFMQGVPTRMIIAEDTVLAGMAAIAAAPQSYAIDYARCAVA